MFCLFLVCMDLSFTFNLCNLKTPLIRQSHRLSNKRELTVFTPVSSYVRISCRVQRIACHYDRMRASTVESRSTTVESCATTIELSGTTIGTLEVKLFVYV